MPISLATSWGRNFWFSFFISWIFLLTGIILCLAILFNGDLFLEWVTLFICDKASYMHTGSPFTQARHDLLNQVRIGDCGLIIPFGFLLFLFTLFSSYGVVYEICHERYLASGSSATEQDISQPDNERENPPAYEDIAHAEPSSILLKSGRDSRCTVHL